MKKPTRCGVEGAVYVEMLIVLWPLALLWLGIGQLGMLYAADILATHAAARAVRAAIVILPDDKEGWEDRYADVEPLKIGGSGEGLDAYASAPAGGRLDVIRRAARLTMSAISPRLGDSLLGLLTGYFWTNWSVAVTFPSGNSYLTEFSATQDVTARVTYLFPCVVPIVDHIMCSPYYGSENELPAAVRDELEKKNLLGEVGEGLGRGLDEQARRELDTVDGWVLGVAGLGLSIGGFEAGEWSASRFVAVRAEATMPMQGRQQ